MTALVGYAHIGFETIWVAAGLMGYWELVIHLRNLPYFKGLPEWAWKIPDVFLPLIALGLFSGYIDKQSIMVFITYITAVSVMDWEGNRAHIAVVWFTTAVGAATLYEFPMFGSYDDRFLAAFLVVGILTPVLHRYRPSLNWVLLSPLFILAVMLFQWYLGDGETFSDVMKNLTQLLCMAIPFWIYLRERLHRVRLLAERLHDPLTTALNRRGFAAWQEENKHQEAIVLTVDLDDFKHINDTFGHDAGDAILVEVVHRLKDAMRETDAVVRMGGDEFVCVAQGIDKDHMDDLATRVHRHVNSDLVSIGGNQEIAVRVSIGGAFGLLDAELLKQADQMLLRAKRIGKNQICLWDGGTVYTIEEKSPLSWVADAMRSLVENSPQGFVLTDVDHRIIDVNRAFEQMSGFSRQDLLGKRPKILAASVDTNMPQYEEMKQDLRTRFFWKGTFSNRRPDGEVWEAADTITAIVIAEQIVGYWALVQKATPGLLRKDPSDSRRSQ